MQIGNQQRAWIKANAIVYFILFVCFVCVCVCLSIFLACLNANRLQIDNSNNAIKNREDNSFHISRNETTKTTIRREKFKDCGALW